MVAIVVPIATGGADVSLLQVAEVLIKAILFFAIVSVLGLWIFLHKGGNSVFFKLPFIRHYGLRDLIMLGDDQSTLLILIVTVAISLLANLFEFHPAIGAYMAALILMKN